jgi:hypothetical protein
MVEALLLSFLRSLSSTNHVRFSQIGHVQPSGTKVCTWPFSGTASSSRAARDEVKWPAEGLGLVEALFSSALRTFGFQLGQPHGARGAKVSYMLAAFWSLVLAS